MINVQPMPAQNHYNPTFKPKRRQQNLQNRINSSYETKVPCDYRNILVSNKELFLQDYNNACEYFNSNFEKQKPLFGNVDDTKIIESNPIVKKNLCKFLVEKSASELNKLYTNNDYSAKTDFNIKGYTQIHDFFKEYLKLLEEDKFGDENLTFNGHILADDERYCKNLIHGYAGACSLISAAAGALSAGSADVWALRPLQGIMFLKMQNRLQVPFIAATEYMAKEMFSAAVIGTEGAKILIDVLGWGTHAISALSGASVVSGGSTHAATASASAAAHGSLSFMLTEKMGRGFLSRVRNDSMTTKAQTAELGAFFGLRAVLGGLDLSGVFDLGANSIDNTLDPEMIKQAYENIPKGDKDIIGHLMGLLSDYNATKLGYSFAFNFSAKMLANFKNLANNGNVDIKQLAASAFKDAFLLTAIYDLYDFSVGEVVSHNAAETIKNMQNNLEDYPEAFKVFKESENKFFNEIDLDNLDEKSFRKHFTNKAFLSNISIMTKEQVKEYNEAWRRRKDESYKKAITEIKTTERELNNKQKELEDKHNEINTDNIKNILTQLGTYGGALNPKKGFGYGRVAGYDKIKTRLTSEFITPILTEKENPSIIPPEGILFYGPTNTGKTTLAAAVIEQSMSERNLNIKSFYPDDFIYKVLCNIEKTSIKDFEEKQRRTILQIDEIEGLSNKPKSLEKLNELLADENKRISVIGTTNRPKNVDPLLTQNFIKMYIGPADCENMKSIMEYYLEDYAKNLDINKICKQLSSNPNGAFSNNQLKTLCNIIKKYQMDNESVLKQISTIKPEISKDSLNEYTRGNRYV